MAIKWKTALNAEINVIKNEIVAGDNTATRVGDTLRDIADSARAGRYILYEARVVKNGNNDYTVQQMCNEIGNGSQDGINDFKFEDLSGATSSTQITFANVIIDHTKLFCMVSSVRDWIVTPDTTSDGAVTLYFTHHSGSGGKPTSWQQMHITIKLYE